MALALAPRTAPAQGLGLSPAGSLGLVLLDAKPGLSLAGGARFSAGPLLLTGVVDLAMVGWGREDGRYEWQFFSCRDTSTGRGVSTSYCPDPEVRWGAVFDAALVLDVDSDVLPMLGAG